MNMRWELTRLSRIARRRRDHIPLGILVHTVKKVAISTVEISGVRGPKLTKFVYDVEENWNYQPVHLYCDISVRFGMPVRQMMVGQQICHKNVCHAHVPWKIEKKVKSITYAQIPTIW